MSDGNKNGLSGTARGEPEQITRIVPAIVALGQALWVKGILPCAPTVSRFQLIFPGEVFYARRQGKTIIARQQRSSRCRSKPPGICGTRNSVGTMGHCLLQPRGRISFGFWSVLSGCASTELE